MQACPLNPAPELQSEQEFSQRFAHVIRGVIDFAGMIPGFQLLTQDDKFTLLKAGLFDALFVRLICMFDTGINSIICLNGQVMRRDIIREQNGANVNARFLVDSTFSFAERMNAMNLTDSEVGLFCAIVLISEERHGLRDKDLIKRMNEKLRQCLQTVIMQNRPNKPEFMDELMGLIPDLRTLSTLHTEKLVVFRTERQQMWNNEEESNKSPGSSSWGCDASSVEDIAKSPLGSVSSTESDREHIESYSTQSLSASAPLLAATLSGGCPVRNRASSGSSAEDDIVGAAHLAQNGLTITPVVRSVPINSNHLRYRKLDSPTDSGIESGNEKHEQKPLSSGSSSCSSPRSSLEDQNDDKRQIVEDMPVLKRVLQAPPLYDTNSLMDEAYKPHKKFRAMRQRGSEAEAAEARPTPQMTNGLQQSPAHNSNSHTPVPPATVQQHQSQLHMHLTRPQHQQASSLSSTHSILAKSLMEEPRMTPEQMKRSELLHNYIMRESQSTDSSSGYKSPRLPSQERPQSGNGNLIVTVTNSPSQCPFSSGNSRWPTQSVITSVGSRHQQTPSPNSSEHRYFQSPHSTSTSPPVVTNNIINNNSANTTTTQSPRLIELQVDIADPQQPLNLSKKSPSPPPQTTTTTTQRSSSTTQQVHKVLLEA